MILLSTFKITKIQCPGLVSDLKTGVPDPDRSQQYADLFAELAKKIQEDFGVSPKQPIKTSSVSVGTEDTDDNAAAVNDSEKATSIAQRMGQAVIDKGLEFVGGREGRPK